MASRAKAATRATGYPGRDSAAHGHEKEHLSVGALVGLSAFWWGAAVWIYVFILLQVPSEIADLVAQGAAPAGAAGHGMPRTIGAHGPTSSGSPVSSADLSKHVQSEQGTALGICLLVGALVSTAVSPVFGSLSDHSRSPFGRRMPFIILGVICASVAGIGLFQASTFWSYTAWFAGIQASIALSSSAFNGLVADRVPPAQRGVASGIIGASVAGGNMVGALVGLVDTVVGRAGLYVVVFGLLFAGALTTAVFSGEAHRAFHEMHVRGFLPSWFPQWLRTPPREAVGFRRLVRRVNASPPRGAGGPAADAEEDASMHFEPGLSDDLDDILAGVEGDGEGGDAWALDDSDQGGERGPREDGRARRTAATAGTSGDGSASHALRISGRADAAMGAAMPPIPATPNPPTRFCPLSARHALASLVAFLEPFTNNDFKWVFISRLSYQMGIYTVQEYLLYFIRFAVELPEGLTAPRALSYVMLPLLCCALLAPMIAGWLSDVLHGRRRTLLVSAGGVMVVATFALAFTRSWDLLPWMGAAFGLGYGVFNALDFALALDVLPNTSDDAAKDLGLWNLALAVPMCIAAPVAGMLLDFFNSGGGTTGFTVLFLLAGAYITGGIGSLYRLRHVY